MNKLGQDRGHPLYSIPTLTSEPCLAAWIQVSFKSSGEFETSDDNKLYNSPFSL